MNMKNNRIRNLTLFGFFSLCVISIMTIVFIKFNIETINMMFIVILCFYLIKGLYLFFVEEEYD